MLRKHKVGACFIVPRSGAQCADDDPTLLDGGQTDAAAEYIEVALNNALEQFGVDRDQRPQRTTATAMDEIEERTRFVVIRARTIGFKLHERDKRRAVIAVLEVLRGDAETAEV